MRGVRNRRLAALVVAALLAGLMAGSAQAGERSPAMVEPQLRERLASGEPADFWVYLRDEADLAPARAIEDRAAQGRFVHDRLTRTAAASQAGLRAMLAAEGVPHQPFWIANTVRVTGDAELLERIAARPEVAQVTADRVYALPAPIPAEAEPPTVQSVEWNIDRIGAPEVWDTFGATGEGIVVGTIDGGAEFDHPALVDQYRGNLGGGEFDHNYHWHDPSEVCGSPSLVPCDNTGHGTHVLGTIVGDDGGDNRIGVAPDARWIAAKGCEFQTCSQSALLSAGQFMLAPTDLQGNNPRPELRPHIVNNSWGGGATADPWYRPTVEAWLDAGIFPQFANGNTQFGVAPCGSAGNPGNLPESYSAGAFDIDNEIADFSNRGASAWDDELVKPDIAAPGANIRSSVPGGDYAPNSGTSMASPHVAGAVALLWSAADALVRDVDATRDLLDASAVDVEDLSCGGASGDNNVWGEGRLDVLAAMERAPRGPSGRLAGTVTDAGTGDPIAGATVTVTGAADRERSTDEDGTYGFALPVGEFTVTASGFGYVPRTVEVSIVEGETTTLDLGLAAMDRIAVTGQVTDGSGHGWPLYARVDVLGTPVTTFTNPVTGRYELTLPVGETYELRASPQYPGYAAATGTVVAAGQDVTLDLAPAVEACEQAPGYQPRDGECRPVEGGLVLGQVTDENTGDPVSGATVTSVDSSGEVGRSAATPDDPATGDGFYWLFSTLTGDGVRLTAAADGYAGQTRAAAVVADGVGEADFVLPAGRLAVDRQELAVDLRLGESAERTFTVTNTGTAPAELALGEIPGSFQVLGGEPATGGRPSVVGKPWRAVPDPGYDPDSPTTRGRYPAAEQAGVTPSAPGDVIASWSPGMPRPWGVGVDGEHDVWLSDGIEFQNYEFTADGTPTGAVHPAPAGGGWPADLARLGERELCQVRVGDGNGIHCWDTATGEETRSITGPFPWTADSQRGLSYREEDDTFYIGGWNQDVFYQIRGFGHERPGEVMRQCSFPGISGLAWNSTAELLWVATNSPTDDVFLLDPAACTVVDTLGHPSPGFNGAGLALNDDGNLWMVSQGSEPGTPKAVYLVESGVPDVADVAWLAPDPQAATVLAPGDRVTVTVSMDSAAAAEGQPGTYTAQLLVGQDTPYPVDRVDLTMVASPPRGWGKLTGVVTGIDCGGEEYALAGATVRIDGRKSSGQLRAGAEGRYTYWTGVNNNRVAVSATADGHEPASTRAVVTPTRDTVVNLALRRTDGFGYRCEPVDAAFAQADTVLPISGRHATETIDLPFPFRFYGEVYGQAHVCSNGIVEFVGPATSFPIGCSFPAEPIPTPARPNAAIYPYRDANLLVDDEASIRTAVAGSAPDRRFVIEFRNLRYADVDDPDERIDFNVVLHENGDVLTQYRDVADTARERGGSATVGIEDHTGTDALQYSYQQPVLPVEPAVTSIRYRPPPPPPPEPAPESWVGRYGGAGDDVARASVVSPDGTQVFVTGYSPDEGSGQDYATVAYDAGSGEQLWEARYDGPVNGDDLARAIGVSPDGTRVFVTGYSSGGETGDDYATVAYDARTGAQRWVARHDGPTSGGDQAYALAVAPDGGQVFVTGRSLGDPTSFDYATVAYDAADGTESWAARYDGPVPAWGFDQAFAIAVSPDGTRVFVTGESRDEATGRDYATVTYGAADGTQSWVARYAGAGDDIPRAIGVSPDGTRVFVTGQSEGDGFDSDYATVAYAAGDGAESWLARYDGPAGSDDLAWALAVSPDGAHVFVTGQSLGVGTGYDYATLGYGAADGTQSWAARYDGPVGGADVAGAIGVSSDGVFVAGQSQGGVSGSDYATVAYHPGTGEQRWAYRYQGPVAGDDVARALAVSPDGARVFVTGDSTGAGTGVDYATLAYAAG